MWLSTLTRDSRCTRHDAPGCTEASVVRKCHPTSSPFPTVPTSTCWPTTRINLCWLRKWFYWKYNQLLTKYDYQIRFFMYTSFHLRKGIFRSIIYCECEYDKQTSKQKKQELESWMWLYGVWWLLMLLMRYNYLVEACVASFIWIVSRPNDAYLELVAFEPTTL